MTFSTKLLPATRAKGLNHDILVLTAYTVRLQISLPPSLPPSLPGRHHPARRLPLPFPLSFPRHPITPLSFSRIHLSDLAKGQEEDVGKALVVDVEVYRIDLITRQCHWEVEVGLRLRLRLRLRYMALICGISHEVFRIDLIVRCTRRGGR